MKRPEISRRSPSAPAFHARESHLGYLFFDAASEEPSAFVGRSEARGIYGSPEAWAVHQLFRRCGYSGMLRSRD